MRNELRKGVLLLVAAVALGATGGVSAADGDATISGSIRYNAVLENAGDPQTTYEASLRHYVFEAGPSTVGTPQPLDVNAVETLCGDKDGCQITLQMSHWDGSGATRSRTSWLFGAPTSGQWRFDEPMNLKGHDHNGVVDILFQLFDCYFSDGEVGSGNALGDSAEGFGLLNSQIGSFPDETTVCRVVLRD